MTVTYHARRWIKRWAGFSCSEITVEQIEELRNERSIISNQTANKELRHLRSLFNWGMRKKYIEVNPASVVDMMRVEKKEIYVPSQADIEKVFSVATKEQQDYLWCLRDTFGRSREINQLKWGHVNFEEKTITLYTRKKKYGTKTPRTIPMTKKLIEVLTNRYIEKNPDVPWVFWHKYYSRSNKQIQIGPFKDRKKFMKSLCKKAEVEYFRFHPFRHAGATMMEGINIPIADIQEILGHENRKTTECYIHSHKPRIVEAIRNYENNRILQHEAEKKNHPR